LIEDLRPRYTVTPRPEILSVFGSDGYEGDYTVAPGATVALAGGHRRFRNITIGSGAIVNVTPGFLRLQASGSVTIAGTINLTPLIAGGSFFGGSIPSGSQMQANTGAGLGGAAGHNSAPRPAYSYSASNTSSGGASGFTWNVSNAVATVTSSTGGVGGGSLIIEAAGLVSVTGTINASGGNASPPVVLIPAANNGTTYLTGGGGGSGGLIWLQSAVGITCSAASTLSVRGGNGSNGGGTNLPSDSPSHGGGGGGGGWLVFSSPLNQTTGSTLTVTGGTAGTSSAGTGTGVSGSGGGTYAGQGGGSGSAGSVGQVVPLNFLPI
jgi:hypothetical protein